jgi:hypothetical protein
MSRLTKQQAALHTQACVLLQKDCLSFDERLFVLAHWQEGANHVNGMSGAFFTPQGLATDFAIEVSGYKVIDLCAGIGSLAFAVYHHSCMSSAARPKITCVEVNPDYVAVGKKVLPEATWIVGDVLDLPASVTGYHVAIANPPFGRIKHEGNAPRYTGAEFEYKVIDVASDRAAHGVFLIPQSSSPFRLSGVRAFKETTIPKYERFAEQTAIRLEPNCGLDTSVHNADWRGVSIVTEIVLADFQEARLRREPPEEEEVITIDSHPTHPWQEPSAWIQDQLFAVAPESS